ncbi:hypothetical protein H6G89_25505 [Oscillatoria sp. FACHB-1407]|uniref:hypothetical protein n=1 Tax=Oscillatoria sp. FACHB-1407 TaxID=2692847 RepID=UPI001682BC1B|nr:hypothetical protein [Oscillatoria sp. FACHB-1407]MBD2464366.1 hypothetical protein [Oscillatoria sp. FACHB-1407]
MEQFKFALGPYEVFASIIGGLPLTLAICLAFNPGIDLQAAISIIQGNFSTQIALVLILLSYLLGGLIQGITWKYFVFLCELFKQDYHYFGSLIETRNRVIEEMDKDTHLKARDFEDKLTLLLREKVGIPKKIDWINPRVNSYLREHNRPSAITAESHQATHIMYRNISFGLLFLGLVSLINLLRANLFSVESLGLILLSIALAYIAFFRALSFKRWHERELLLGFYFAACDDQQK